MVECNLATSDREKFPELRGGRTKEDWELDVQLGKRLFITKCACCHSFNPMDGHFIGPNLHGIMGSPIAKYEDYEYSDAMKEIQKDNLEKAESGADFSELQRWTKMKMSQMILCPDKTIPGTKMEFPVWGSIRRRDQRKQLITYLQTLK